MSSDFEDKKMKQYASRRAILDLGVGILWTALGIFFIFSENLNLHFDLLASPYNYFFGGLWILYGGFRIYRGIKQNYFK